ncbi:hypothetical protein [Hymenobacter norwichensis]|uniref:hypothetical protein n=1 Tax=Hymenobacter norwichensis TaxID=223903 RepID=UPI0003B4DDE7|nr:hypothetical protein [Hymenobacter norwichensis]
MKQKYAFLSWGLLLLMGCEKSEPQPALLGQWEWVQSQATGYTSAGAVVHTPPLETPLTSGPQQLVISADSLNVHTRYGIIFQGYRRDQQVLTITPERGSGYTMHIQELTANRLVMKSELHNLADPSGEVTRIAISEFAR